MLQTVLEIRRGINTAMLKKNGMVYFTAEVSKETFDKMNKAEEPVEDSCYPEVK